jgi:hypothetical protein
VRLNRPPELAVYVECEGPVVVAVLSDSFEDELRLAVDVEGRDDVLGEIERGIAAWMAGLRERRAGR